MSLATARVPILLDIGYDTSSAGVRVRKVWLYDGLDITDRLRPEDLRTIEAAVCRGDAKLVSRDNVRQEVRHDRAA